MPEQEQGGGDIGPSAETTADAEAAAPLNREQRRAQAKGKKGGGRHQPRPAEHAERARPRRAQRNPGAAARFQRKTGGK